MYMCTHIYICKYICAFMYYYYCNCMHVHTYTYIAFSQILKILKPNEYYSVSRRNILSHSNGKGEDCCKYPLNLNIPSSIEVCTVA